MKSIFRSCIIPLAAFVAVIITSVVARWYWSMGSSAVKSSPEMISLSGIIIIIIVVFGKFFLYDIVGRSLLGKVSSIGAKVWFYTLYALGLAIDLTAVFMSSRPVVDAGFASIGMIVHTPIVLIVGLVGLLIQRIIVRRQIKKQS